MIFFGDKERQSKREFPKTYFNIYFTRMNDVICDDYICSKQRERMIHTETQKTTSSLRTLDNIPCSHTLSMLCNRHDMNFIKNFP